MSGLVGEEYKSGLVEEYHEWLVEEYHEWPSRGIP